MDNELLASARAAKSPEELLKLAHDNGMPDFTEENAEAYYNTLHKSGELTDDELEGASGGCRTGNGERVVTVGLVCPGIGAWECETCHQREGLCTCGRKQIGYKAGSVASCFNFGIQNICGTCAHSKYIGGRLICTSEKANSCK